MRSKRILYWYCLIVILILTPIIPYVGMWLFGVQVAYCVCLFYIGFGTKKFTLFDI